VRDDVIAQVGIELGDPLPFPYPYPLTLPSPHPYEIPWYISYTLPELASIQEECLFLNYSVHLASLYNKHQTLRLVGAVRARIKGPHARNDGPA